MLGRERALRLAERVLGTMEGDENQVSLTISNRALTRLANSEIHQNVTYRDCSANMRTIVDDASGYASCNQLDDDSVRRAADYARRMAMRAPAGTAAPMAGRAEYPDVQTAFDSTLYFDADRRAQAAAEVVERAASRGLSAAGAISSAVLERVMINDRGLQAHEISTEVDALCVISSGEGSGYAARAARDAADVDFAAMATEAAEKCEMNREGEELPPGQYTVFLDEYAVGDMLAMLSSMGFGADQVAQGSSFMTDHFGERLVDERLNISDDALDQRGLPDTFDLEGVPRSRVSLIDGGRPVGAVHDLTTASREGCRSTGHAGPRGPGSPSAAHLFVQGGDAAREDMLATVDFGLYITRFHYIAPVNAAQTRWTGMTRDGVFVIDKGEVSRPVQDVRFDERILGSMQRLRSLSRGRRITRPRGVTAVVPAMVIDGFNITGSAT